ncbi:MAG: hypothetical protein IPH44_28930 [Myxococcales bacterium]|mgnify:FL=1|nr:hypothetical protein [Myxococcales bacterium]MBK7191360.1 hypothetical protein [Myxococcales bacterium]
MKQLLLATLSTFTLAACVEASEATAPTELVAPEASLADPSAITATTPLSDDPAALAPQCGDGAITYWDWVCLNDGRGWLFMAVGYRDYHCNAAPGTPYFESLVGRATTCSSSDRSECSTASPSAACTWQPVGAHCRITRPTTYCWVRAPQPLPLPVFR